MKAQVRFTEGLDMNLEEASWIKAEADVKETSRHGIYDIILTYDETSVRRQSSSTPKKRTYIGVMNRYRRTMFLADPEEQYSTCDLEEKKENKWWGHWWNRGQGEMELHFLS